MANGPSIFLFNANLPQIKTMRLLWKITAAKTVSPLPISNSAVYSTFDAIAAQSTIDNFLGTTSEFTIAQFDATAMGADTFGVLVNMQGQALSIQSMVARCYSNTGGLDLVTRQCQASTTLPDSTNATEIAVGADGNIGLIVVFGNTPDFDGLTSGTIDIEIVWLSV